MEEQNKTNLFSSENIDILINLAKSYGNDFDLGNNVRSKFRNVLFVQSIHNDETLGKEIRKILPKFQK